MRKFLSIFLTIAIVVPFILAALMVISVNSFALDRNFYIQALESGDAYKAIFNDITIKTVLSENLPFNPTELSPLTIFIKTLLTPDYINTQMSVFINGFFDFLQGKASEFNPSLDLIPLKTEISSSKQRELLLALAAVMPVCEPGQLPGFDAENKSACKPAGITDATLADDYLLPVLPLVLDQIPDAIPLGSNWGEIAAARGMGIFRSGMAVPASLMLAGIFIAFVALSFWFIATLLSDESWRVRLQWLGWTLLIPSMMVFIFGLAAAADITGFWIDFGLKHVNISAMPFGPAIGEVVRSLARSTLARAAGNFLMVSGISGALAIGLIFWGMATPRKVRSQ